MLIVGGAAWEETISVVVVRWSLFSFKVGILLLFYGVSVGAGGGGASNTDNGTQGIKGFSSIMPPHLFARPGVAAGHGDGGALLLVHMQWEITVTISGTGNGGGGSSGASGGTGYDPTDRSVSAPSGETWTFSNNAGGNGTHGGDHSGGGGGRRPNGSASGNGGADNKLI